MTGASLEVFAGGDRVRLLQLHQLDNARNLVPDAFKEGGKADGAVRWGEVVLAARDADRLGLDPVANLKLFPVIKGQVWPMAEVWVVLARRHGWRVTTPVDTAERCVVHMVHRITGETPPDFEMTLEEARGLGAAVSNPNYKNAGARSMVRARAVRTAIKLNAPEVMQDPVAADWGDIVALDAGDEDLGSGDHRKGAAGSIAAADSLPGEVEDGGAPGPNYPPRSIAPSGATIPEHLREPEVDEDVRMSLQNRVDGLTPESRDALKALYEMYRIPGLRTHRFTRAHGALLSRLISEVDYEPVAGEIVDEQPEAASHDVDEPVEVSRYTPEEEMPF